MNLVHIKQQVGDLERAMSDNPLTLVCILAGIAAVGIILWIAIDAWVIARRKRRGKAAHDAYLRMR